MKGGVEERSERRNQTGNEVEEQEREHVLHISEGSLQGGSLKGMEVQQLGVHFGGKYGGLFLGWAGLGWG